MAERLAVIEGLKSLITFLENCPELKDLQAEISIWGPDTKEEMANIARAMGTCSKMHNDAVLILKKCFGPVELKKIAWRNYICERKVVGTKTVTKQTPIGFREEQVEEEIIEWECPSILKEESNDN